MAKFEEIARAWYVRRLAQWQRANRIDAGNPEFTINNLAFDLYMHPGLREHFKRYIRGIDARQTALGGERPSTSFTSSVERALANIERDAPPVPADKPYFIY